MLDYDHGIENRPSIEDAESFAWFVDNTNQSTLSSFGLPLL